MPDSGSNADGELVMLICAFIFAAGYAVLRVFGEVTAEASGVDQRDC